MTLRLDRNRPFGEVLPSGGFYQDGNYFDAHGEFVRSDNPVPAPEPPVPAPPAPTPAPPPAPALTPVQQPAEPPVPATDGAGSEGTVDLVAWAKREVNYPNYRVVQAMKAAYPGDDFKGSRAGMIDLLVAKGVVAEGEAVR